MNLLVAQHLHTKPSSMLTCVLSRVRLFVTSWTVARRAPLSMGFSRQECWGGLLCPPPGDLPDPGFDLHLLHLLHWQVGSLPLAPPGKAPSSHEPCVKPTWSDREGGDIYPETS